MKNYPSIDTIFKAKEERRKALAELSIEEKIDLVFRLAERRKFIESGRGTEKQTADIEKEKDDSY